MREIDYKLSWKKWVNSPDSDIYPLPTSSTPQPKIIRIFKCCSHLSHQSESPSPSDLLVSQVLPTSRTIFQRKYDTKDCKILMCSPFTITPSAFPRPQIKNQNFQIVLSYPTNPYPLPQVTCLCHGLFVQVRLFFCRKYMTLNIVKIVTSQLAILS